MIPPARRTAPDRSVADAAARRAWLCALLVVVAAGTLAAHWSVLTAQALTLDDQGYVTFNHLVRNPSWGGVRQFFAEVRRPSTIAGYYQPLTMVSLMADWALGARVEDLCVFHRTSLALHTANAILVTLILWRLFDAPVVAAVLGLLFGAHPLSVEPVAWITERKTLLAAFFSLATVWYYLGYVRRPGAWRYSLVAFLFVLALLSKPTSTPLPVLLLLLDFWPLGRLGRRALVEKLPLLLLAGVSAIVTFVSQAETASVTLPHEYGPWRIPLTICHNLVFYLRAIVWPVALTSFNAVPQPFSLAHPAVLAGVVGTALLAPALILSLRWTRALATGWLVWFVGIFPTLGVIGFTHLIAADKYTYLPALGFVLIGAWALRWVWTVKKLRAATAAALVLVCAACAYGTRRQLEHWQTTESLYLHMLRSAPNAAMLHDDYGNELTRQRRLDEACAHFRRAIELDPTLPKPYNNLGVALLEQGQNEAALPLFETAIRLDPNAPAGYNSLGTALARLGRYDEAQPHFERALKLDPHIPDIHVNLGNIQAWRGDWVGAAQHFEQAVRLRRDLPTAQHGLGLVLVQLGQAEQALEHLRVAVRLKPDELEYYRSLGRVLVAQQHWADAATVFEAALRLAPGDAKLEAALRKAREQLGARGADAPE